MLKKRQTRIVERMTGLSTNRQETAKQSVGHLDDVYGMHVSPDLISRVTDAVLKFKMVRAEDQRPRGSLEGTERSRTAGSGAGPVGPIVKTRLAPFLTSKVTRAKVGANFIRDIVEENIPT